MSRLGRGTGDDGAVREIQIQERERGVIKDIPKASREREDLARDVQMNGRARGVKIAAGRNSPTPPTARRIVVSSFAVRECPCLSMAITAIPLYLITHVLLPLGRGYLIAKPTPFQIKYIYICTRNLPAAPSRDHASLDFSAYPHIVPTVKH